MKNVYDPISAWVEFLSKSYGLKVDLEIAIELESPDSLIEVLLDECLKFFLANKD